MIRTGTKWYVPWAESAAGPANSAGRTLESTVIGTLTSKGFQVVSYRDYLKKPDAYGRELLPRNAPFTAIYGQQNNVRA